MATDIVFDPQRADEARCAGALPKPTVHSGYEDSPRGRGPLDPTFEADPLGARGLRHATPPQPTEKDLLNTAINRTTNRLQELQREVILLQADIDKMARRLAAFR